MLNKVKASISIIILSFILAACSSSGGGSGYTPNDTPTTNPDIPTTNPDTPTTNPDTPTTNPDKNIIGSAFIYKNDYTTEQKNLDKSDNLKVLVVNGVRIPIVTPTGITSGEGTNINGIVTSGTNYKDSVFGTIRHEHDMYLYAQGNITPEANVPAMGTAKYHGSAALAQIDGNVISIANPLPTVDFNVDFAKKSMDGVLTVHNTDNTQTLNLEANISGNKFNGVKDNKGQQITTTGQFNGVNAGEMSGHIVSPGDFNATFGAIKQ